MGWSDSTMGKVLTLQVANLSFVIVNVYGFHSLIPDKSQEYHWATPGVPPSLNTTTSPIPLTPHTEKQN